MKRAERQQLGAVIEEVRAWINTAHDVQHLAAHMPLSGQITHPEAVEELLTALRACAASGDLDEARPLLSVSWFDGRKKLQPAHEAASRLTGLHAAIKSDSSDTRLGELHKDLRDRRLHERDELARFLLYFGELGTTARKMLFEASHLPITLNDALSAEEIVAAEQIIHLVEKRAVLARRLLDGSECTSGACSASHHASKAMYHAGTALLEAGALQRVHDAASRITSRMSAEQAQLAEILDDLRAWQSAAARASADADLLPLTRNGALSEPEQAAIHAVGEVYARHVGDSSAYHPGLCEAGSCGRVHQSNAALASYYSQATRTGQGQVVVQAAARVAVQLESERVELRKVLNDLTAWRQAASQALHDAKHMPLTQVDVLSASERVSMESIDRMVGLHEDNARALLDHGEGSSSSRDDQRQSAALLWSLHADAVTNETGMQIVQAARRLSSQRQKEERRQVTLLSKVKAWPSEVDSIRETRSKASTAIIQRTHGLAKASKPLTMAGRSLWLVTLRDTDSQLVSSLTLLRDAALTAEDEVFLSTTSQTAASVTRAAEASLSSHGKCKSDSSCLRTHETIRDVYESLDTIEKGLDRLEVRTTDYPSDIDRLLEPSLGFERWLTPYRHPELLPRNLTERLRMHLDLILDAQSISDRRAAEARKAAEAVRVGDVARALRAMDLEVLRKASPDRIRVTTLEANGLHNVWDVLQFQLHRDLASVPRLGQSSAVSIAQAALRLHEAVREETPVRIDVKRKSAATLALLESLRSWDVARSFKPSDDEISLSRVLRGIFENDGKSYSRILVATRDRKQEPPPSLQDALESLLEKAVAPGHNDDIWMDFLSRPADYFGMLTELGFMTEDEKKMHGDLPEEIVEAVRAKELDRNYLTASLRAYQSFGARFALVQQKVVLGDEMGLGKTVEALAMFTHLRAKGESHFLVVCPAAVVTNWIRETTKHTRLSATRLHGPLVERKYALKTWTRIGGVAVTTYDMLPWVLRHLDVDLTCAVFDEAHYIKNPLAKRSVAAAEIMDSLRYAVLMTGTPLENSVQEFRNLIGYIRPDLSEGAPEFLASKFRKHVAPAYLRRNQEDVLTELPELVEIEEWLDMSTADENAYRQAVEAGQFMLMRRAAMLTPHSHKVARLKEIVEEAESNGRRVIVYSYFREVLQEVSQVLRGDVFGPITGSTPAAHRQALVDRFSQARHGSVLVAQITAGGVGLNIQSASVVVICEPQLKPTLESQAIARAHRMGQVHTVQVHRLLTENSVDERIRDILETKRQLFDEFARDSVIARQAPDAVDISEVELARIVVAAERERLFAENQRAAVEDKHVAE